MYWYFKDNRQQYYCTVWQSKLEMRKYFNLCRCQWCRNDINIAGQVAPSNDRSVTLLTYERILRIYGIFIIRLYSTWYAIYDTTSAMIPSAKQTDDINRRITLHVQA